jgi:adenylate kinase
MLKAQTVGTIVMRSDESQEILMINDKALEMMNLAGYKGSVTATDIRNEFEEDQLAIVDENMKRVQEDETEEVSYEVSITNGVIRRYIFTSARHVLLSNNDDVIILCMTDLTELEERRLDDNDS